MMTKASTITNEILKRIDDKIYQRKVPGQRQLASEFNVNVKTINRAVNPLVKRGILFRRKGEGTFITADDNQRHLTIGLCFFKHTDPAQDPVFTRFFFGANTGAKHHGVRIHVYSYRDVPNYDNNDDTTNRRLYLDMIREANIDGLIFIGNIDVEFIHQISESIPSIVIGLTPADAQIDSVRRDVFAGTADAVKRLHAIGHQRIALASVKNPNESYDLAAKEGGYLHAIEELGLQPQILRCWMGDTAKIIDACSEKPTAIVCVESGYGLHLMKKAHEFNIKIPQDLAVISFDDGDIGSFIHPTMSGIHAFGEEVAASAMEHIIEKIEGRSSGLIAECLECPYFERETTVY